MTCTSANALWLAGCLPEAVRFRTSTRNVRAVQLQTLRHVLRDNEKTGFGRRCRFRTITSAREYQARVPIGSYEAYEPEIVRIAAGERGVLTRERVRMFEPTSGSATATKLIPYTRALQHQFQRGIKPWIADLFVNDPDLMRGQAYWSVSPATHRMSRTLAGIPIGFDDDAVYVGGWRALLVRAVMAAPASLRHTPDIAAFQYETLLALVRSDSLRLISIWNPTFLSIVIGGLLPHAESLLRDLRDTARAGVLRRALNASTTEDRHAILWPWLRLISCWADANAAAPAARLAAVFPQARIQPKGLIATEGFVSLPLVGREASVLAVRSHFFEFAPVDSRGAVDETSPLLAHELECGRRYAVILTTAGGLYRYRLDDIVEVTGREKECPLIRFTGRHGYVSDWFGEKLHEATAAAALASAAPACRPAFTMLACDPDLSPPAYVLYVDSDADDGMLLSVAADVDARLRANFHYDCARLVGQLGPVRVFRAAGGAETYLAAAIAGGRRAGDVKPLALDRRDGWSGRFTGSLIPPPSRNTPSGSVPLPLAR
jgi:GH3 auxin-responsive promoter